MFKIEIHDHKEESGSEETPDVGNELESEDQEKNKVKIEICYFCHKKFDINKDDSSHYKYGQYPMCAYCSEFYGFYSD